MSNKLSLQNKIIQPRFKIMEVVASLSETIDLGLQMVGVPDIWTSTKGAGVKVCLLDTGIDYTHIDLKNSIEDMKDFTGSVSGPADNNGHGTHCSGIIAANAKGIGMIGVAPESKILMGKVLGDNGRGDIKDISKGIEWAISKEADIISMSLGCNAGDDELKAVVKKAFDANIILVAASGNESLRNFITFPARYDECIAVGSVNAARQRSFFANGGSQLDIMAPGEDVYSTFKGGIYARLSGTSMAAPFVAGVCALALSKHKVAGGDTPIVNRKDMLEHLIKTADDIGPLGFDFDDGFGLINPRKLLDSFNRTQELKSATANTDLFINYLRHERETAKAGQRQLLDRVISRYTHSFPSVNGKPHTGMVK